MTLLPYWDRKSLPVTSAFAAIESATVLCNSCVRPLGFSSALKVPGHDAYRHGGRDIYARSA